MMRVRYLQRQFNDTKLRPDRLRLLICLWIENHVQKSEKIGLALDAE